MMNFLKELNEARLLYSEADLRISYKETCENLYLMLLAIEFMAHCKQTKSIVQKYAQQTTQWYPYNQFRTSGTDLHNFISFVTAEPARIDKLYGPSGRADRERTQLPLMALNGYLTSITNPGNRDIYFLMRVEQALSINSSMSKDIRRMLAYHNPTDTDMAQLASRILNEFRNRMPNFDLLPEMSQHFDKKLTFDK
jgi:hypothetical protein